MAHACHPRYSGGRDQEDCNSKPAQANSHNTLSQKKKNHKTGLTELFKWPSACLASVWPGVQNCGITKKKKKKKKQPTLNHLWTPPFPPRLHQPYTQYHHYHYWDHIFHLFLPDYSTSVTLASLVCLWFAEHTLYSRTSQMLSSLCGILFPQIATWPTPSLILDLGPMPSY
jgi:hypothetical protein